MGQRPERLIHLVDSNFRHCVPTSIITNKTKTAKTKQKPSDIGSFLWHGQVFLSLAFYLVEIYSLTYPTSNPWT